MLAQVAASLGLVLIAPLVWRNSIGARSASLAASFLVFFSLLLIATYVVIDQLTGNGIDRSVLFHLATGLKGAGIAAFKELIAVSVLLFLLVIAGALTTFRLSRSNGHTPKQGLRAFAGLIAVIASFFTNPASRDILALSIAAAQTKPSQFVEAPEIFNSLESVEFLRGKKNIVYLFLESVERTYLDQSVFPGLMPNLAALEEAARSFTDIRQVSGTSWTISGMAAALCGIPLNGFTGNSMSGVDRFLPGATCVGDLLDPQGYELQYLGGASLDYAGKGNFFESHSFDLVEGREELARNLQDPDYLSPWGLYDDTLYDVASKRFDELSRSDEPFGLFLLTVDTHHPNGHLSSSCDGLEYGDGSNPMLNVVHCADQMLGEFVKHVLSSPVAKDTVLVVASDHLAMPNKAWDQLNSVDRKNLLLFFSDGLTPGRDSKPGSTLDIGPTLLSLAGAETDGFGFGRNLLAAEPTLTSSLPSIDRELDAQADFLAAMWSFAQVDQGIRMDQDAEHLVLGSQRIGYPVLISLDEQLNVVALQFEFYADHPLVTQVEWLDFDKRFIWIDKCRNTARLVKEADHPPEAYCAVFGALGMQNLQGQVLRPDELITFETINEAFEGASFSQIEADDRLARMQLWRWLDDEELLHHVGPSNLSGDFLFKSAGFGNGDSFVVNLTTDEEIRLERGINVVGLNDRSVPMKLFHLDTCGWDGQIIEMENTFETVGETLSAYADFFSGFAVLVDDSAVCSQPVDLAGLFADSPLKEWGKIEFRTPYLAFISADGSVEERTGEQETAILLEARQFLRSESSVSEQRHLDSLPRIAHAGGFADDVKYTNSFNALDQNRPYFDLFEIDFVWTSDDHLVCLHDWAGNFRDSFGVDRDGPVDLAEFEMLAQNARFQNCTLASLVDWLEANPGVRIVPDVKDRNEAALQRIATDYSEYMDRFIPQIYQPGEYTLARSLGFEDVIWTIYRYHVPSRETAILSWLKLMDLYGLAMPVVTAEEGLALRAKRETGVLTWAHTVNSQAVFDNLRKLGVAEIMTESLLPPQPLLPDR